MLRGPRGCKIKATTFSLVWTSCLCMTQKLFVVTLCAYRSYLFNVVHKKTVNILCTATTKPVGGDAKEEDTECKTDLGTGL